MLERRAWRKESTSAFLTTINFSDRTAAITTRGGSSNADYELEKRKDAGSSMNVSTLQAENAADYAV